MVHCQEQVLKWAIQDILWLNLSSNKCTGTCWLVRPRRCGPESMERDQGVVIIREGVARLHVVIRV